MHKKQDRKRESNRGFTLVELIVVIVILAILAAILVPALLGYIDKAKGSQDMLSAKNMMNVVQAEFTNMYAKGAHGSKISGAKLGGNNNDVNLINSEFSKKIFETADDKPYLLIVGLGRDDIYGESSNLSEKHKAYTVYFVAYWKTEKSKPIFFNGSEWTNEYAWKNGDYNNTFTINGTPINIQNYLLAGPNANDIGQNFEKLKRKTGVK